VIFIKQMNKTNGLKKINNDNKLKYGWNNIDSKDTKFLDQDYVYGQIYEIGLRLWSNL
jgi:hypothetical protein